MWQWSVRMVILLWVAAPAVPVCLTSLNIKGSEEQCSFHYAAQDQLCSDYHFTHCLYVNKTLTKWLWILSGETKQELVRENKMEECGRVCCKQEEGLLPTGMEGYQLCQQHKFQREAHSASFYQLVFEVIFALLWLSLIAALLYTIFQELQGRIFRLWDHPQQVQMRLM